MSRLPQLVRRLGYYKKPEFMIIGCQKAGTSALWFILNQNPKIVGPSRKEVGYFSNDEWYGHNRIDEYHLYFPLPHELPSGAKLFESSPGYIYNPKIAERLYRYNPKLKLIVLLRNPIERALSAWTMYHYHMADPNHHRAHRPLQDPRSFKEAIETELEQLKDASFAGDAHGYISRGLYQRQIEALYNFFPASSVLIIESRELRNSFDQSIKDISNFLELPDHTYETVIANKSLVGNPTDYLEEKKLLHDFFRPHNEALFSFLGKRYDWNDEPEENRKNQKFTSIV